MLGFGSNAYIDFKLSTVICSSASKDKIQSVLTCSRAIFLHGDLEKAVDSTISDFMTLRLKLSFKYSMQPSVEPVSTIMTSSKYFKISKKFSANF